MAEILQATCMVFTRFNIAQILLLSREIIQYRRGPLSRIAQKSQGMALSPMQAFTLDTFLLLTQPSCLTRRIESRWVHHTHPPHVQIVPAWRLHFGGLSRGRTVHTVQSWHCTVHVTPPVCLMLPAKFGPEHEAYERLSRNLENS